MFNNKVGITGRVKAKVYDENGRIKRYERTFWDKLFGRPARKMIMVNHNIVTNEGDDLIADLLQETPERTKFDNANAVIGVGTGFVAEAKTVDALVSSTGSPEGMDVGYPQTAGDWAAISGNVVVYKATFEAGDLNDTGIDEAILSNGTDTMAYAEISPAVNVGASDTLEVTWEITFLGS